MKIVELDGYAVNPGDLSWETIQALGEFQLYDRTLSIGLKMLRLYL